MNKVESADLILKLYDLRREEVMRKARNWTTMFSPKSAEEIGNTMMNPEIGPFLRMVLSYWDMAASFVNHGAIDAEMFYDTSGELVMVYAKIEPYLAELREMFDSPDTFKNLEKVVNDMPNGKEKVKKMQEWLANMDAQPNED